MITILAEDGITVGSSMYFVATDMPVLYKIDCRTKEIVCAGIMYNESISLKQASRKIVKWGEELVIVPYNASHIYFYNTITGEMSAIDYPGWDEYNYMYIEAFAYDDKVIMIGAFAKNIIELNMLTKEIVIRNNYFEIINNPEDLFCRSGYVVHNNYLFIGLAVSNSVLKINLKTWEDSVLEIGDGDNRFSGIAYDGNNFWLTARRGKKVIKWAGNSEYEVINLPFDVSEEKCNFGGVYYYDNRIWIHGFEGGYSAIIDPKSELFIDYNERRYRFFRNVDNECIIRQDWDGVVYLCTNNNEMRYDFEISKEMLMKIKMMFDKKSIFGKNNIANENDIFGIDEFVEMISK